VVLATLAAACSAGRSHAADPPRTEPPRPDYTQACAPSGIDSSAVCLGVTLAAIDAARAREGVGPMRLPADFGRLPSPEQVFIVVDTERVDRGLAPFTVLTAALNAAALDGNGAGAARGQSPTDPGRSHDTEWIGGVANALDADYSWVYNDGPGTAGCVRFCWADRHLVLDRFPSGVLAMGAAMAPTADTDASDRGGPSLAAIWGTSSGPTGEVTFSWSDALADIARGVLQPLPGRPPHTSAGGVPDPPKSVPPDPDFTRVCAPSGLDSSTPCIDAVAQAIDHARAAEGVGPIVLPPGYAGLTVPQQVLVAVNLERAGRHLPPFTGLIAALDANAQRGADTANDPPDPGPTFDVSDAEWAGGSSNGLDAVYGWMYDDGAGSGNLDCPTVGSAGCWGHREEILDDFGSVGTLVMGAALNPTGDNNHGDSGGTSIAATLAITDRPVASYTYRWSAAAPPGT
jgi:hypothetical protein